MVNLKRVNEIAREMLGSKMTEEQRKFQETLRRKVKKKEITVEEAHEIWDKKYPRCLSELMKAMRKSAKKGKMRRWKC